MALMAFAIIAMMVANAYYWQKDFVEFNRLDHPLVLTTMSLFQLLNKCFLKIVHLVVLYWTGEAYGIIRASTIFMSLMS
jgi:hypothetical protein